MIYIALAGYAGAGKSVIADYLAEHYGFIKCSFSDALYDEAQAAFELPDQELLRNRDTKEAPSEALMLLNCKDPDFIAVALTELEKIHGSTLDQEPLAHRWLSPRQVLQWWGTEYRRAQNPDYWVQKADEFTYRVWEGAAFPEQRRQLFVNDTCRFPNEQAFVHKYTCGNVWHVRRDGVGPINGHVSDVALPVLPYEREIWNNDTIEKLYEGVDALLATSAQFVRCEPMLPDQDPAVVAQLGNDLGVHQPDHPNTHREFA